LEKKLIGPSQAINNRFRPIVESLQKSHHIKLTVLQFNDLPFCGSMGSADKAVLLVNEEDVNRLTDDELNFVLSHEWCHVIEKDAPKSACIRQIFDMFQTFMIPIYAVFLIVNVRDVKSAAMPTLISGLAFLVIGKISQFTDRLLEKRTECRADAFALRITHLSQDKLEKLFDKISEKTSNPNTRSLVAYRRAQLQREGEHPTVSVRNA